jgi:hypothetical protein
MDWIDLAKGRNQCFNPVNTFRCHKLLESSWVAAEVAGSWEGLNYTKLVNQQIYITNISCFPYWLDNKEATVTNHSNVEHENILDFLHSKNMWPGEACALYS